MYSNIRILEHVVWKQDKLVIILNTNKAQNVSYVDRCLSHITHISNYRTTELQISTIFIIAVCYNLH